MKGEYCFVCFGRGGGGRRSGGCISRRKIKIIRVILMMVSARNESDADADWVADRSR